MISLVVVVLLRLFSILRIFAALTPIVIMLSRVLYDLQAFLFFFTIIIFKFAMVLSVLGVGNVNVEGRFREKWKYYDFANPYDKCGGTMPGIEYQNIGIFNANFARVLRLSIGDFSVLELVKYLPLS